MAKKIVSQKSRKTTVVNLDPEFRKECERYRWQIKLERFLEPLSEAETGLIHEYTKLLCKKPSKKRENLPPCEIIQFPAR